MSDHKLCGSCGCRTYGASMRCCDNPVEVRQGSLAGCDHKFLGSNRCAKCGLSIEALRAQNRAELAPLLDGGPLTEAEAARYAASEPTYTDDVVAVMRDTITALREELARKDQDRWLQLHKNWLEAEDKAAARLAIIEAQEERHRGEREALASKDAVIAEQRAELERLKDKFSGPRCDLCGNLCVDAAKDEAGLCPDCSLMAQQIALAGYHPEGM